MRGLPLVPDGCALTAAELAKQRARAEGLRGAVAALRRTADTVEVGFAPDVDRAAVEELVAVERRCCSFLEIDLSDDGRLLRIAARSEADRPVVAALASAFGAGQSPGGGPG